MEQRAKQPHRWVSPAALKIAAWFAACVGLALAGRWPLEVRVPLASALIVVAAIVIVRAAIGWLGPLFLYDVIRTSRRGQPAGLRIFYAALLLTMLLVVGAFEFQGRPFGDLMAGRATLDPHELADMAKGFFAGIMTVQFIIILLVTPLYVAPAIAEEKERRSLEFLLTTELSDREIVLGMLGARLANLMLLLLTGVPIMMLVAFLGGVSPSQVLAALILTAMTVLALSSLSILSSTLCRTALVAIASTYGWTAVLFFPATCIVVPALTSATPEVLLGVVLLYTLFQGAIAIVCAMWAVSEMRPLALVQGDPPRIRAAGPRPAVLPVPARPPARPTEPRSTEVARHDVMYLPYQAVPDTSEVSHRLPVFENALRWKELHAEQYLRPASSRDFFTCLTVLVLMLACVTAPMLAGRILTYHNPGPEVEPWVRSLTIVLTFGMMLITALNSAGRVSRERERDTLGALLLLPVTTGEILFTKWLGGIASVRWCLWGFALVWIFGVVSGGLNICAVPLLAAAIGIYIGVTAAFGLWLSTVTSTLRATLLTVLLTLMLVAGPANIVQALEGPWLFNAQRSSTWWAAFLDYSMTPATVLASLGYRDMAPSEAGSGPEAPHAGQPSSKSPDGVSAQSQGPWKRVVYALVGLHIFLAIGVVLLTAANSRILASRGTRPRLVPRIHTAPSR
jgi:ABC-type transport system involved in multi-copper enzyme maturation permease subunit